MTDLRFKPTEVDETQQPRAGVEVICCMRVAPESNFQISDAQKKKRCDETKDAAHLYSLFRTRESSPFGT